MYVQILHAFNIFRKVLWIVNLKINVHPHGFRSFYQHTAMTYPETNLTILHFSKVSRSDKLLLEIREFKTSEYMSCNKERTVDEQQNKSVLGWARMNKDYLQHSCSKCNLGKLLFKVTIEHKVRINKKGPMALTHCYSESLDLQ